MNILKKHTIIKEQFSSKRTCNLLNANIYAKRRKSVIMVACKFIYKERYAYGVFNRH